MELSGFQDNGSSSLEGAPRLSQSMSSVQTASIKKKRGVLVMGNSLLTGKRSEMQTTPTLSGSLLPL